jgi:hypothetical protein
MGRKRFRLLVILLLVPSAAMFGQEPSSTRNVPGPLPVAPPRWSQPIPPAIPIPPITPRPPIAQPGPVRFRNIARSAGLIFSGTVTSIEHPPPRHDSEQLNQEIDTVAITFHVENAIRGTTRNTTLTIRQWMGVWSSGQRYRVGERLILFLYPPSRLGLTSWVGGRMGRFDIDAFGRVTLSAEHLSAFHGDPVLGSKKQLEIRDFVRAIHIAEGEP